MREHRLVVRKIAVRLRLCVYVVLRFGVPIPGVQDGEAPGDMDFQPAPDRLARLYWLARQRHMNPDRRVAGRWFARQPGSSSGNGRGCGGMGVFSHDLLIPSAVGVRPGEVVVTQRSAVLTLFGSQDAAMIDMRVLAAQGFHSRVTMLPVQSKMARAATGFGIRELAKAAGVSADTISRLERGETLHPRTLATIRAALEAAGVEFTNGDAPGVRLRPSNQKQER